MQQGDVEQPGGQGGEVGEAPSRHDSVQQAEMDAEPPVGRPSCHHSRRNSERQSGQSTNESRTEASPLNLVPQMDGQRDSRRDSVQQIDDTEALCRDWVQPAGGKEA